ncbi:hypothetical protein MU852_05215 [Brevundimonas albigilva]|uniref:hypothetical protein n=1 Tax=Brevundimonas TaxID=41275 RepID=UPI00201B8625|nr:MULTISPECIES: hypothetical protein [Brevundimonas]UQV19215.1 hypothetical protein MU852_05215 [Brevundimonas albigilva]
MSPRVLMRAAAWIAGGVTALVLLSALLGGLGLRWDPLGFDRRRLERAEAGAALGRAEADARRLEAQGAADQMRRLDQFHQREATVGQVTAAALDQARSAADAHQPLETDRADRLRRHDGELCGIAPDLDGCAGAAGPAGSGDAAVRPGDPAR